MRPPPPLIKSGPATEIAKKHSINKVSIVMIVRKFKIMRSGPKTVTVPSLFTALMQAMFDEENDLCAVYSKILSSRPQTPKVYGLKSLTIFLK